MKNKFKRLTKIGILIFGVSILLLNYEKENGRL